MSLFDVISGKTEAKQPQTCKMCSVAKSGECDACAILSGPKKIVGLKNAYPALDRSFNDPPLAMKTEEREVNPAQFKSWFKGSKIVDRSGKPLLVWHGIKSVAKLDPTKDLIDGEVFFRPSFKRFGAHSTEPGIYFARSAKDARKYGTPVAFYLKAKKPVQHGEPLSKPRPGGADAIYRFRGKGNHIEDAWEIAVFDSSQVALARGSQGAIVMESDEALKTKGAMAEERETNPDGTHSCGVFMPLPYDIARQFPNKDHEDDSVPHITMLYVGDASPADYAKVVSAVRRVCTRWQPFLMMLDVYAEFHNPKGQLIPHMKPSTHRLKTMTGSEHFQLGSLHADIRQAVERTGVAISHTYGPDNTDPDPVKDFKAHATLDYLPGDASYDGPKPSGSWGVTELECWGHEKYRIPLGATVSDQPQMEATFTIAQARARAKEEMDRTGKSAEELLRAAFGLTDPDAESLDDALSCLDVLSGWEKSVDEGVMSESMKDALQVALTAVSFGKAQHKASFASGFKDGWGGKPPSDFGARRENAQAYAEGVNAGRVANNKKALKLKRLADYGRGNGKWAMEGVMSVTHYRMPTKQEVAEFRAWARKNIAKSLNPRGKPDSPSVKLTKSSGGALLINRYQPFSPEDASKLVRELMRRGYISRYGPDEFAKFLRKPHHRSNLSAVIPLKSKNEDEALDEATQTKVAQVNTLIAKTATATAGVPLTVKKVKDKGNGEVDFIFSEGGILKIRRKPDGAVLAKLEGQPTPDSKFIGVGTDAGRAMASMKPYKQGQSKADWAKLQAKAKKKGKKADKPPFPAKKPKKPGPDKVKINGMLLINNIGADAVAFDHYARATKLATDLVKKRGFGFMLKNVRMHLVKGMKPGVLGNYNMRKKTVEIFVNNIGWKTAISNIATTMVHELGHHYYYKEIPWGEHKKYAWYFQQAKKPTKKGKKTGDFPSAYARSERFEDFAELFAAYIGKGSQLLPGRYKLTRDMVDRLKTFLAFDKRINLREDEEIEDDLIEAKKSFMTTVGKKLKMPPKWIADPKRKGVKVPNPAFRAWFEKNKNHPLLQSKKGKKTEETHGKDAPHEAHTWEKTGATKQRCAECGKKRTVHWSVGEEIQEARADVEERPRPFVTEGWIQENVFQLCEAKAGEEDPEDEEDPEAKENRKADADYLKWVNGYSDPWNERGTLDEIGPGSPNAAGELPEPKTEDIDDVLHTLLDEGWKDQFSEPWPGGPVSQDEKLFKEFGNSLNDWMYKFMDSCIPKKGKGWLASVKQAKAYAEGLEKLEAASKAAGGKPEVEKPKKKFKPSAYQQAIFDWVGDAAKKDKAALVVDAKAGAGKCLGWGTPVLMSDGRVKPVQEIEFGDRLMGPDGEPRTVLDTTVGHGDLFEVKPVKGDAWICNDVHVLTLVNSPTGEVFDIPLNEYLKVPRSNRLRDSKLFRVGVPFDHQQTAVDPYLIGAWLGDGAVGEPRITTPDTEIHEHISALMDHYDGVDAKVVTTQKCPYIALTGDNHRKDHKGSNPIRNEIKRCYVDGEKRILDEYLRNDRDSRLQLLAGLLDTDGYYSKGYYEIVTKYPGLRDDILFLARSLGFAAYAKDKIGRIVDIEFEATYCRVIISGHVDEIPCRVERKKAAPRKQKKNVLRTGFRAHYTGKGDYYGFQLDQDGRFLLGDFTVTHNSTTMEQALDFVPQGQKVVFLAFNKDIAEALAKRVRDKKNVEAATINAFGNASVAKGMALPGGKPPEFVKNKTRLAAEPLLAKLSNDPAVQKAYEKAYAYDAGEAVTKRKMMGTVGADGEMAFPEWDVVLKKFNMKFDTSKEQTKKKISNDQLLQLLEDTFQNSVKDVETMDYADQVLWPVMHDLPIISKATKQKANLAWAMVDEVQDLAPLEREFVKRLAPRHVLVGDPNQSIYAFKGSDPDSMAKISGALSADEKPLSICYRCPLSVIEEAQKLVPGIQARKGAPKGSVKTIKHDEFYSTLKPGDFVLCRTNAPNIESALGLIAQGKKANVVGRDIGTSLGNLIRKISGKGGHKLTIDEFREKIAKWHDRETKRLTKEKKEHLIQGVDDKRDCLHALMSNGESKTAGDLITVINDLFVKDPTPAINFSSVHKAKGLEADNVYIQRPDLMPFPTALKSGDPVQIQQEWNLKYVAITRAKKNLTWVTPPPKDGEDESDFVPVSAPKPAAKPNKAKPKPKPKPKAKAKKPAKQDLSGLLDTLGDDSVASDWESEQPRAPSLFERIAGENA